MKQTLLRCSVALYVLLAGGCHQQDDPQLEPAPQLEGRWEEASVHYLETTPTGDTAVDMLTPIPAGTELLTFTTTDLSSWSSTAYWSGSSYWPNTGTFLNRPYTRNGNILVVANAVNALTIQRLTATELILFNTFAMPKYLNTVACTFTYRRL